MFVTNVCDVCWRGCLSTTSSHFETFRRAPLTAATTCPEVRSPSCLLSSPTCSTSQEFSRRGCLSHASGFLHSLDKKRAQFSWPSRAFGTLERPSLRKNVSCSRSTRRYRIRSGAGEIFEEAAGGVDGESTSTCLYVKRTIHNGEVLENSGSVIILGDVEPGGQVLADGDVVVLGRLQGSSHAGRAGDVTSRIFATCMEPQEIRIYDSLLSCPDNNQTHIPKMAALSNDGSIKVFPAIEEAVEKQSLPLTIAGMSFKVQIPPNEGFRNRRPATVAMLTGIYISVAGIALLGFPKALFGTLFDLEGVQLGWVRVVAVLAVVFGVYYIGTAIGDMRGMNGAEAFYLSTVVGRTFLFLSFSCLVLTGAVPSPLFLVGAVNLVGAMVMLKALLKSPAQSSG
ncbi:unnamed protein product [Calypogeia fissa]